MIQEKKKDKETWFFVRTILNFNIQIVQNDKNQWKSNYIFDNIDSTLSHCVT